MKQLSNLTRVPFLKHFDPSLVYRETIDMQISDAIFSPTLFYLPRLKPGPHTQSQKKKSGDLFDRTTLKPWPNVTPLQTATPCHWVIGTWVWGPFELTEFQHFSPVLGQEDSFGLSWLSHSQEEWTRPLCWYRFYGNCVAFRKKSVFPENNSQEFIPSLKKKIHRTLREHTEDTGQESL